MNIAEKAILFATHAFTGKYRKASKIPAIFHSLEAGSIAASMTDNPEVLSAVVLHDVIEDTDTTETELRREFGDRITELVLSDSENKREDLPPEDSWKIRKQETIDYILKVTDRDIKILYLSDKLANMRSIYTSWLTEKDNVWKKFNQKDPKEQYWYYHSIQEALSDLKNTAAWREYARYIREIFHSQPRME